MPNAKKPLPKIIPPRSMFRLVRSDRKTPTWSRDIGKVFRIGYYSKQDGLDCIWLVNNLGEYEQTVDRDYLLKYFEPVTISSEINFYGIGKPKLRALKTAKRGQSRSN
jgi:hypothetical protein